MKNSKKVIILGGGLSGLATAFYLDSFSKKSQIPIKMTLLEASSRLGGMIQTRYENGFLFEEGPDAFLSEKNAILDLCRDLQLSDQLISTQENYRRSFIYQKGRLKPVPKGFYLMSPTDLKALWELPQISMLGKLRMALEIFIPPKTTDADESIADFVCRRFGREAYEKLAEPMLSGIYSGDLFRLSLKAIFPKFKALENKYGSLLRGYTKEKTMAAENASGPRYSLFLSFKMGMATLIDALKTRLDEHEICHSSPVVQIEKKDLWNVYTSKGDLFQADAICLSLPAYAASDLVKSFNLELSQQLSQIRYESIGVINLAYDHEVIPQHYQGFGFVVPKNEGSLLLGCSFSSLKFERRAPQGKTLLRVFVGRNAYKKLSVENDKFFIQRIHEEIQKIFSVKEKPLFSSLTRYEKALPQYELGHGERILQIKNRLDMIPGIYLTGSAYSGVGIPDLVGEAKKTAECMLRSFNYAEV